MRALIIILTILTALALVGGCALYFGLDILHGFGAR